MGDLDFIWLCLLVIYDRLWFYLFIYGWLFFMVIIMLFGKHSTYPELPRVNFSEGF